VGLTVEEMAVDALDDWLDAEETEDTLDDWPDDEEEETDEAEDPLDCETLEVDEAPEKMLLAEEDAREEDVEEGDEEA
jgi:hypothetical protein